MKKNTVRLRFLVMIAVLAVVAVGYFTAAGIGSVCGIGIGDITLLCPLGALLAMIAERTAIPFALLSLGVALVICIVLGKVFCSWVCPVHFLEKLRPKGKKAALTTGEKALLKGSCSGCATCAAPCGKSEGIVLDSRHAVLVAAIISTLVFGFPVFCVVCPVGLTFTTVFLIMRLFAFGETTWTIILFIGIILVETLVLPRWCRTFCPLGALHSLMSGPNRTFRPRVDEDRCLQRTGAECNRCVRACPEGINLHDIAQGATTLADCSKCKACSDVCPVGAITFPFLPSSANRAPEKSAAPERAE